MQAEGDTRVCVLSAAAQYEFCNIVCLHISHIKFKTTDILCVRLRVLSIRDRLAGILDVYMLLFKESVCLSGGENGACVYL